MLRRQDLELAGVGDGGVVRMPTKEQLTAAGRKDLVAHISEAGGFLEVSSAFSARLALTRQQLATLRDGEAAGNR